MNDETNSDTNNGLSPQEREEVVKLYARVKTIGLEVMFNFQEFLDEQGNTLPLLDAIKAAHKWLDETTIPRPS